MLTFFFTLARFSLAPVGLSSRSRVQGTQGGRLYTTAQVLVPSRLRVACFGRSKSQDPASNHGIAFRGARAEQDNRKPTCQRFCSTAVKSSLLCGSHGRRAVSRQVCVDHSTAYACLLCAMIRVRVFRCVRVCVLVCWNPTFQLFVFVALVAAAV